MGEGYDFSGWATRNDIKCSDGRTIRRDAFKDQDGETVPLVWNHQHNQTGNVLGHAMLENRDDGVYAYCSFNETEAGRDAKEMVKHGDIKSLSIFANKLRQQKGNVCHGVIREVSLVLAGANPGAFIDNVLCHSEDGDDYYSDEDAVIYNDEEICSHSYEEDMELIKAYYNDDELEHGGCETKKKLEHAKEEDGIETPEEGKKAMAEQRTIGEIFDELTDEQKQAVYAIVGKAVEDAKGNGGDDMKHNCFDNDYYETDNYLSHADMENILADAKQHGSLKDSFLAHAADYGIDPIDYLFPEAKSLNDAPEFIKRPDDWVTKVTGGVHHTPFSRIKSVFADITEDDARAKGYIKGNRKKEEVFTLLKRSTTPTTIYKKQKLDRDDIIDITDFDVVAWLKLEMRGMLDEEIARAILVGDGRSTASDDKINEQNIRPIWKDDDLFTLKVPVSVAANATDDVKAKTFIKSAIKARKDFRGSGTPTLYCTEECLTNMLLIEDAMGRVIYDSIDKLKTALRVNDIVTVPVLENLTRQTEDGKTAKLMGLIVNLNDYNIGADKGGAVNMFDDFDIDYNQQKYLIETRCSGALTKPFSAMALEEVVGVTLTTTPCDPAGQILGKDVDVVQSNVQVNENSITGTLYYVNNWTQYSADTSENSGNFVCVNVAATPSDATVTVSKNGGAPKEVDDGYVVARITDPKKDKLTFTVTSGENVVSKTYNLGSLRCKTQN